MQAGSSGISRALAAWFPNSIVRVESRFPNPTVRAGSAGGRAGSARALAAWFPNPTVRAGSAGGLKRETVASRTDRQTHYMNLYIRLDCSTFRIVY